jgi:hypothetical protein
MTKTRFTVPNTISGKIKTTSGLPLMLNLEISGYFFNYGAYSTTGEYNFGGLQNGAMSPYH